VDNQHGGQTSFAKEKDMPKASPRERLADLENRQRAIAVEAATVRQTLRATYGALAGEIEVERLSEREFRDILTHAIRAGGGPALAALKALASASAKPAHSPERRPSDEHGGAARRRPASASGAAAVDDGAGQ
jgi:hypothetical protein